MVALLLFVCSNSDASFYRSYKISSPVDNQEEERIRKLEIIMDHLIAKIKKLKKQQRDLIFNPNPPYYIPVMKVK